MSCQHPRCTKCPRYPPLKGTGAGAETAELAKTSTPSAKAKNVPAKGDVPFQKPKIRESKPILPSGASGEGLVLTTAPARSKPRHVCHRCSTPFDENATVCTSCEHTRCKKCPVESYATRSFTTSIN